MVAKRKISLVLADVDGTLVNEQKELTKRAQNAVARLRRAGIGFAITSGRPPLGMAMLFDPLGLDTPIAGFNGGLFVKRDLTILEQKTLPIDVAREAIDLIRAHGLDAWVYRGNDWLITKADAPHVAREAWTREIFRFATITTSVTSAQSSGLQARPSRASNSSAAAGPLPPAA